MLIQTPRGLRRRTAPDVEAILAVVSEFGGNPWEWYADTTSDIDEALAYHMLIPHGDYLWVRMRNADRATELKAALATKKIVCPDSRSG